MLWFIFVFLHSLERSCVSTCSTVIFEEVNARLLEAFTSNTPGVAGVGLLSAASSSAL